MLQQTSNPEDIDKLAKLTSFKNIYDFTITYNRHKNKYGMRLKDFPESYGIYDSSMNYRYDPDYYYKFRPQRLRVRYLIAGFFMFIFICKARVRNVEEFDRQKRMEQRNMQNVEIDEVYGKYGKYTLYNQFDKPVNEKNFINKDSYVVFWYDAKMKNYLTFLDFLIKRKFIQGNVRAVLIVDRIEYMTNIEKIKSESRDEKLKSQMNVMLKKQFTDTEKLVKAFDNSSSQFQNEEVNKENVIELDLKKSFFYVLTPEGKIIDCAKIYSFLHEENIHKRIMAKISKDIDDKMTKSIQEK
ncbi:UNKNOWN [Stylonychia lemnae]|uniref:Uncharacterized protein n=1 Tax=Stylonychia lemnae TaxID=5949 RepID=A0A078AN18_STYLE|nr:UNKNOWN [Stylonychia lemnae]|eukprot:CDW82757.1 UNKNOWN [Stylonychia lemnae]